MSAFGEKTNVLHDAVYVGGPIHFVCDVYAEELPLDVTSLWNLVEVIPLCNEEVGQLGTGDTFVSCARCEKQRWFVFFPVLYTDCPVYNLIDYYC